MTYVRRNELKASSEAQLRAQRWKNTRSLARITERTGVLALAKSYRYDCAPMIWWLCTLHCVSCWCPSNGYLSLMRVLHIL